MKKTLRTHTSQLQGFTLVELLVVVAIISILASIALPNFQNAQIKAKVTAAFAEMRSLATAIEAYQLDHNTYPLDGNDTMERDERLFDQMRIQRVLTTPTVYISEIPEDIFHTRDTHSHDPLVARYFQSRPPWPYVYRTKGNVVTHRGVPRGYNLFSFGPDQVFDNASMTEDNFIIYDPSNGVVSAGDILFKGF